MLTVLDLMESSMAAEAKVRKAVEEYGAAWIAPLQKAAEIKNMFKAGAPRPDSKPEHLQLARRAAQLVRGERKE